MSPYIYDDLIFIKSAYDLEKNRPIFPLNALDVPISVENKKSL